MEVEFDKRKLVELAHYKMPYGKYKERYLVDLPEAYFTWFRRKGFPKGKLGELMQSMYEIKINGLEPLVRRVQKEFPQE